MARALLLAERGRGRTSPNPMVGALVVDDEGVVVGRGRHESAGGPHAEVHALVDAGERAAGATLYCTLEPCSHTGRTGPCAPRVVAAGIRRAVVAVGDPNPLVSGRGIGYLREHGIDVTVGVLAEQAEKLNEPFFTRMRFRRPFVTMKVALSLDGCVAAAPGIRTQLTGPSAARAIHRERAEIDALAVGSGTVLADDPLLTARGIYRYRPLVRVVFDRRLRTPVTARLFSTIRVRTRDSRHDGVERSRCCPGPGPCRCRCPYRDAGRGRRFVGHVSARGARAARGSRDQLARRRRWVRASRGLLARPPRRSRSTLRVAASRRPDRRRVVVASRWNHCRTARAGRERARRRCADRRSCSQG